MTKKKSPNEKCGRGEAYYTTLLSCVAAILHRDTALVSEAGQHFANTKGEVRSTIIARDKQHLNGKEVVARGHNRALRASGYTGFSSMPNHFGKVRIRTCRPLLWVLTVTILCSGLATAQQETLPPKESSDDVRTDQASVFRRSAVMTDRIEWFTHYVDMLGRNVSQFDRSGRLEDLWTHAMEYRASTSVVLNSPSSRDGFRSRELFVPPFASNPRSVQTQLNSQKPGVYVYFEAPGSYGSKFTDHFRIEPGSAYSDINVDKLEGQANRWKIRLNVDKLTNIKIIAKANLAVDYLVLESSTSAGGKISGGQNDNANTCGTQDSIRNEAGNVCGYKITPPNKDNLVGLKAGKAAIQFNVEPAGATAAYGGTMVVAGQFATALVAAGLITPGVERLTEACRAFLSSQTREATIPITDTASRQGGGSYTLQSTLARLSMSIDTDSTAFVYTNTRLGKATYILGSETSTGRVTAYIFDDGSARCYSDCEGCSGTCDFMVDTDGSGSIDVDPILTSDRGQADVRYQIGNEPVAIEGAACTRDSTEILCAALEGTSYAYFDLSRPDEHVHTYTYG